jgi:hypothetical protein
MKRHLAASIPGDMRLNHSTSIHFMELRTLSFIDVWNHVPMSRISIRLISRMVAVLTATIAAVAVPNAAQADPITGVTCTLGTWSTQFDPGVLLLTPQDTKTTNTFLFTNCVSVGNPLLSSGTAQNKRTLDEFTCLNLIEPITATYTVDWDTGSSSTMSLTNYVIGVTVVVTGTVTNGLFAGKNVTITLQSFPVSLPIECLTDGLELITGGAVLDIS